MKWWMPDDVVFIEEIPTATGSPEDVAEGAVPGLQAAGV